MSVKIDIIYPKFNAEQMHVPHDKPFGVIYLPADFYSFKIALRRLWMKPKRLKLMLIMNPVGHIHHEVRELPEIRKINVDSGAVGECGVPLEKRDDYGIETATKLVLRKYKTFIWDPEVEIVQKKPLFMPIYIYRGDQETWLYDTFTGKKILAENPMFSPGLIKPIRT
ncbi:MAG: hypothetical protein ACYS8Y_06905 [Planctomycetota bacterium]|jgi:hypothetical protein